MVAQYRPLIAFILRTTLYHDPIVDVEEQPWTRQIYI